MWSYYGSKEKIAKYYPEPIYDLIIEPFAGTAKYSLYHYSKNVWLNEKYQAVYGIWNWLINEATKEELLSCTDFYAGEDISCLKIRKEHKDLIGFSINRGSAAPRNIVQKWSCQVKSRPNWASTTSYSLKKIANDLDKIKHWKITLGDYRQLPNIEATWFIDPPYQMGGDKYMVNGVDYQELAEWCKSRKGQVIVCENTNANWLKFEPLINITGQRNKTTEAIWYQIHE